MVRHTALLAVLLLVSVALAPAAAGPPPALAQFLASLQPAAHAAPGVFAPLASAPPAVPAGRRHSWLRDNILLLHYEPVDAII